MANSGIEKIKGKWEWGGDENFEDFLKEVGVGLAMRLVAKNVKPSLTISKNDGKWTIRGETAIKTITIDFTPGVAFDETTADGREVKSIIRFEGDKLIHRMVDKNGQESTVIRYIDQDDLQQIEYTCGSVKARRWYKRIE